MVITLANPAAYPATTKMENAMEDLLEAACIFDTDYGADD